jgi:hypothetical protein
VRRMRRSKVPWMRSDGLLIPKSLTLGPLATLGGFVAAVENPAPSPSGTPGTGGAGVAGEPYRRQRSRPLVPREDQGLVCRAF